MDEQEACPACGLPADHDYHDPRPGGADHPRYDHHQLVAAYEKGRLAGRTWAYGLTADEWLHLASEGEDSEVGPCCANISEIRELLNGMAAAQEPDGVWRTTFGKQLIEAVERDGEEHGIDSRENFPLLHRVLDGVRQEIAADAEKWAAIRARHEANRG